MHFRHAKNKYLKETEGQNGRREEVRMLERRVSFPYEASGVMEKPIFF